MMTAPHIPVNVRRCHAIQKSGTQPVATHNRATTAETAQGARIAATRMNAPMRDSVSRRGGWPRTRRNSAAARPAAAMFAAYWIRMTTSGIGA